MVLVLFILWLVLNGHFAIDAAMLEIVLFGLAGSGVIYLFMIKFTRWDKRIDAFFLKRFYLFVAYGAVLVWNVIVANFHVIKVILTPGESPEPVIVTLQLPIKNEFFRSMAANAITLTPGTITIACTEEHYVVHCLKQAYMDGFENSAIVKIILKMEETYNDR